MKFLPITVVLVLASFAAIASEPAGGFIETYAAGHKFNGTILIEREGKVTYLKSFGLANFAFSVPNTPQTEYRIASITKLFTSVLVLQLSEQKQIDLNATIRTYLPIYAGEGADKVTIHQLLNHTSGIYNMDQVKSIQQALDGGLPPYQFPYTSDQILAKFASGRLVSTPGTTFDYNNGDYIILGKIIEHICGKPYETVLKENILEPLHLVHTGSLHQQMIVPQLAETYFYRDDIGQLVPDLPAYPENWYAAGSLYSTVEDLRRFADALFGYKLFTRETLALMTKPGLDDYGYGLWAYETDVKGKKLRVVKRPGQIMGSQTQLYHFMDLDITIVILSNTGTTDLDEFVREIGVHVASEKNSTAGSSPVRVPVREEIQETLSGNLPLISLE